MEKNLGHATAYGYAKSKGYTGTEEEFSVLMASYASVAQDANQSASSAAEFAMSAERDADRAEMAVNNGAFLWFFIEDGKLYMDKTPNMQVDFFMQYGKLYIKEV